eukprot:12617837-Heterocapsa_arctica.AAC.1
MVITRALPDSPETPNTSNNDFDFQTTIGRGAHGSITPGLALWERPGPGNPSVQSDGSFTPGLA